MKKVLLIYGPTAAGKSGLALKLARELKGEIINADSLQVYKELAILSARADIETDSEIPHHLYGFISARDSFSVGDWVQLVLNKITQIKGLPIIVGGTGLYFYSLVEGLSAIPEIELAVRDSFKNTETAALYDKLKQVDEILYQRLNPNDRQRIARALEVYEATGTRLSDWQKQARKKPEGIEFIKTALCPPKEQLVASASQKLALMVQQGVLEEVKSLMAMKLPREQTAFKALGYREFSAHLQGKLSLEEALEEAQRATRHYIRRQLTWHRNQMGDYETFTTAQDFQEKALSWELEGL